MNQKRQGWRGVRSVRLGRAHANQTKRARSLSNRLFWAVVSGSHS